MSNNANEDGQSLDENDINVFRKILPPAKLGQGRPIAEILYSRSIYGSTGTGGVRKSLDRHHTAALVQSSPSSVILDGPGSGGGGSGIKTMKSVNVDKRGSDSDSLSEVLNEDSTTRSYAANDMIYDSLSDVLGSGADESHRHVQRLSQEARNRPIQSQANSNANSTNPSPSSRPIFISTDAANGLGTQTPNIRLKLNAFPTSISNEINNFAEHHSVTKFQSDYLSLDKIKPLTRPELRHETPRRRTNMDETEYAISTISIAFSPDGRTVASTHGDHTVKISCCHTGALIRSLDGHPRTPWTVKYHPSRSNIVASGCLGHQVRIWDWNYPQGSGDDGDGNGYGQDGDDDENPDAQYNYHERKGICLKMIRLRNSIISLSFHPTGSILAIACGHTLHLWVYDNDTTSRNNNTTAENGNAGGHNNSNANNAIEAGNSQDNPYVGQNQANAHNDNRLNGQTVLHQIRYATNLRCVHFPPGGDTIIIGGVNPSSDAVSSNETSYSLLLLDFDLNVALMSPTEFNYFQSIDPEDRRPCPSVEVLKNYRTFLPKALLYNDGGFDISKDGKKLCGCADLWLPFGVNTAAELIEREENEKIASMERGFNVHSNGGPTTPRRERKKRKDLDSSAAETDTADCPFDSPPRHGTLPPIGDCLTPPNPSRPVPTSPPSPPGRKWVPHLERRFHRRHGKGPGSDSLPPMRSNRRQPSGGRYVPHVVVVSLDDQLNALGESTLGKVLEATPLESKASSVTCVKFSPSAEYCLLGYGVREQGQSLPYHPVNSLYRVKGGMCQVASMLSKDDDVNIARFHPESGVGFVYGTKQGRVRVLAPRPWNHYYD